MPLITLADAQGWLESTKLTLPSLDAALLEQITAEVIARLASAYDTSVWTTPTNTPLVVKTIICKTYDAWVYSRAYSENQTTDSEYSTLLRQNAEMLITGLVDGTITIPDVPAVGSGIPSFYPNDASSSQLPTRDDPSLGPPKFSMGKIF